MAVNPFLAGQMAARGQAPVDQGQPIGIQDVIRARAALQAQQDQSQDREYQQSERVRQAQQQANQAAIQQEAIANAPEELRALLRTPEGFNQWVQSQFKEREPKKAQIFGSTETGYFRLGDDNQPVSLVAGKPAGDSNPGLTAAMRMREEKIGDAMRLNKVNEADATAIVDGQVRTVTDPVSGRSSIVNMVTQKTIPIELDQTPVPEIATLPGEREEILSINELAEGTGAVAGVKDLAAKTLGQVFPELVDEGNTDARTGLQQLRNRLVAALSISGRPPVIEQERIIELLPTVGFFESPARARLVLNSLKRELVRQYQDDAGAVRGGLPSQEEKQVRQRMSEVRSIIGKLDGKDSEGAQPKPKSDESPTPKRLKFDAQGNLVE